MVNTAYNTIMSPSRGEEISSTRGRHFHLIIHVPKEIHHRNYRNDVMFVIGAMQRIHLGLLFEIDIEEYTPWSIIIWIYHIHYVQDVCQSPKKCSSLFRILLCDYAELLQDKRRKLHLHHSNIACIIPMIMHQQMHENSVSHFCRHWMTYVYLQLVLCS